MASSVRDYGVQGDGITDDSFAVQRALDGVSTLYFPSGIYMCSNIVVPSNRVLHSDGDALLVPSIAANQCLILRGQNIVLSGLHFVGSNGDEWGLTLDLAAQDCSEIHVRDCVFRNLQRAIRVRAGRQPARSARSVWVTGCTFANLSDRAIDLLVSSPTGVAPYSLQDIHIERNHFEDIAPNSSGKGYVGGVFDAAIYIGGLTSVKGFYLRDNVVYRAGPQFLALSATTNPRVDFVVSGNTVRQEGAEIVINMSYTFSGVDNLIFHNNTCDHVDYEHLFLRNCKNFKISDCHFSRANVGIAIHDRTPAERSYGSVSGCTFEDIECPTSENNGNKGVFLTSDVAAVDFSNCRFSRRNGTKAQIGIEINYFSNPAPAPRLGITVSNCQFEQVNGIVVKSGGNIAFPGHARVTGCSFRRCNVGVSFTYAVGNVVAYCVFEDGNIDVWGRFDVNGLRAMHNLHRNSNAAGLAASGAYVVGVGNGRSIWQVEGCTFRNVKGMHVLEAGTFLTGQRILVWANHDVDASSTGPPPVHAELGLP